MRRSTILPSIILALASTALAAQIPTFEVVSVKLNKTGDGSMQWGYGDGGFSATNLTAKMLLTFAYGIRADLIAGGPSWLDSAHFDLKTKVSEEDAEALKKISPTDRQTMLQPVLVERFHAAVHKETKTLPVYDLVVLKTGSKLTEVHPDPAAKGRNGSWMTSSSKFEGTAVPIGSLIGFLENVLERTVIDKTGLDGKYNITLTWVPDSAPDGSETGPSLVTAVQEELGLRLVPSKGPVETLVIDKFEMPTED